MESETIIEVPLQKPKHKFFVYYDLNGKIKQITKDLSYGFDLDEIITKTENGELNKNNLMIFLGYSGWNNHQLYNELNEKCWKINKDYSKNIFTKSKDNLWKKLTKKIEGKSYIWFIYTHTKRLGHAHKI